MQRRAPSAGAGVATDRELGSGTVLTIALVAVVLVLAAGTGALARVQAARSAAQTAADLGALAAASSIAVPLGLSIAPTARTGAAGGACGLAADVADRNGASLRSCEVQGGRVVQVTATAPTVLGPARATARAGPASARGASARAGPVATQGP